MVKIFLAGAGGFLGSILRYSLSGFVQDASRSIHFPYGTLAVNLIGCFAIGFLSQLAETRGLFTAETRTLVFVGVLGGFTTFSAFGYESVYLLRRNLFPVAASYLMLSVLCGIAAVFAGMKLIDLLWPARH